MRKVVAALLILSACAVGNAGQGDWYTWNGSAGDNDYTNLANWQWGNPTFYAPADLYTLLHTRTCTEFFSDPAVAHTININGVVIAAPHDGGTEIDGGVNLNITNGGSYTVGSIGANGVGRDNVLGNVGQSYFNINHLKTTISVNTGGTLVASGLAGGVGASGVWTNYGGTPSIVYQQTGNLGVSVSGLAHVAVSGDYVIGSSSSNHGKGGGHLSLQGYDVGSTLSIGGMLSLRNALSINDPIYGSNPANLNVTLDATNNGGAFNTMAVGTLEIGALYTIAGSNTENLPQFNLSLAGYTATVGQVFPIITATTMRQLTPTGTVADTLGDISVGWDTTFTLGGVNWQVHKDDPNVEGIQPGVYLQVMSLVPATVGPHMGDANGDEKVDLQDFSLLKAYYNQTGQGWDHGNFNLDAAGLVNLEDFSLLKAHYNHTGNANTVPLTAVPEPASLALLLAGAIGFLRRRR